MSLGSEPFRILLVDDESAIRELFGFCLVAAGYCVVQASSAEQARSIWNDADQKFDLLLSDYFMPGMKGNQLVHELCAKSHTLKCLVVTGYHPSEFQIDHSLYDRVRILQKPISRQALVKAVEHLLTKPLGS